MNATRQDLPQGGLCPRLSRSVAAPPRRSPRQRAARLLLLFAFAAMSAASGGGAAAADQDEIAELKHLLVETRDSMREMQSAYEARIDALEGRISELEAGASAAEAQQEALEATAIEQQTLLEEVQSEVQDRVSIHGYYDFQYIDADNDVVGSFIQNELSIFLRSSTEDEQWTIFSELEFSRIDGNDFLRRRDGGEGEFEVETAWLEYRHSDQLRVRGGKLLLPQYWQTYHYPNLTLSTIAPLMVGNIFPKDIVGVQASGDWWTENERGVSYAAYLGNGGDTAFDGLDRNDDKAIGGRLTLRLAGRNHPDWLDTFDVSISGYHGDDDGDDESSLLGFDTQIRLGRFEFLGELAHGNRAAYVHPYFRLFWRDSGDSLGFYAQPAWRLTPLWHLFYRYDYLDLDEHGWTPWDETRHTLGVNFRPKPNISLKLEFFHGQPEAHGEDFSGVASSIVFNF
jgi:hypothetical protein